MGEIITSICFGGIFVLSGIIYIARLKKEYKTLLVNNEEGEK